MNSVQYTQGRPMEKEKEIYKNVEKAGKKISSDVKKIVLFSILLEKKTVYLKNSTKVTNFLNKVVFDIEKIEKEMVM